MNIKLNQYFPYMRQWFRNLFFGSLLKKILNKKILLVYENTYRHRILPRLSISISGWFSPRDHFSLDRGKVGLNIHVMDGLRNNF